MKIILPHDHFDTLHLAAVIVEMTHLGPPVIRAVQGGEFWVALEGSHRLRAAHAMGLIPEIEEIEYSDRQVDEICPGGWQDPCTVAEIVDRSWRSTMLSFDEP